MADGQSAEPGKDGNCKDIPETAVDDKNDDMPLDSTEPDWMATLDEDCVDKRGQKSYNGKKDEIEKPNVVKNMMTVDVVTDSIVLCVTVLCVITLTFLHVVWWLLAQTDWLAHLQLHSAA